MKQNVGFIFKRSTVDSLQEVTSSDFNKILYGVYMRLLLPLALLISCFSYGQEEQSADVGDFGSNNQQSAETIDNRTTTTVTQEGTPVMSAVAPSSSTYNQDVCTVTGSAGVQTQVFGLAFGSPKTDETCERLKLSKALQSLGLKVGAVSILCQDNRIWWALFESGTPCPANQGLIGDDAYTFYKNRPDRVPDRPVVYREKSNRPPKPHSHHKQFNRAGGK